jgi:deazaflavin-dependent oxidoreductase (nitroreductase family)
MTPRRRLIVWFGRFHVWVYDRTDGRLMSQLRKKPMVIVWSTGRKSGVTRSTALLSMKRGNEIVVVASFYGNDGHPAWFLNLQANPECEVRFGRFRGTAVASVPDEPLRSELWAELVEHWPAYAQYQESTSRVIPVVVLTPLGEG